MDALSWRRTNKSVAKISKIKFTLEKALPSRSLVNVYEDGEREILGLHAILCGASFIEICPVKWFG